MAKFASSFTLVSGFKWMVATHNLIGGDTTSNDKGARQLAVKFTKRHCHEDGGGCKQSVRIMD